MYKEIKNAYAAVVPSCFSLNDLRDDSKFIMYKVATFHSWSEEERHAMYAMVAAVSQSWEIVVRRIYSDKLSLREKEMFRLIAMYNKEHRSNQLSERLCNFVNTI